MFGLSAKKAKVIIANTVFKRRIIHYGFKDKKVEFPTAYNEGFEFKERVF